MNMPNVAPNYPVEPPPSITLQVNVRSESLWLHKEHDISAHHYEMVMGLECLQIGARPPGSDEDSILLPAIFQTCKGLSIQTHNFGTILFPGDFERVGDL